MDWKDDECIRVRIDVWVKVGEGMPVQVQTRKLCEDGVFLEYTGRTDGTVVSVIFPGGRDTGAGEGGRVVGRITRCWPDGVWVSFHRRLRSVSELLMRTGVATGSPKAARIAGFAQRLPGQAVT